MTVIQSANFSEGYRYSNRNFEKEVSDRREVKEVKITGADMKKRGKDGILVQVHCSERD